jgi:hypothetical protein
MNDALSPDKRQTISPERGFSFFGQRLRSHLVPGFLLFSLVLVAPLQIGTLKTMPSKAVLIVLSFLIKEIRYIDI